MSTPNVVASHSMLDQIESLSFGYERLAGRENSRMKRRSRSKIPALSQVRPRGCEFLFHDKSASGTVPLVSSKFSLDALEKLPCVTRGSQVLLSFECIDGHEWNAIRGSPASIYCPECQRRGSSFRANLANLANLKLPKPPSELRKASSSKLMKRLVHHVEAHGGRLTLPLLPQQLIKWRDFVECECSRGHTWQTAAGNALKTWCRTCYHDRGDVDMMQQTANHFGGRYLGIVDPIGYAPRSQALARWRCSCGHEFEQTLNNIRRRRLSDASRGCSWCPSCTKKGVKFEWN